jgi:hypothetical protein
MSQEETHLDHLPVLRRLGKRRLGAMTVVVMLLLALVVGGSAYALLGHSATTVPSPPASSVVSNTFTLSAVTSTPDASRQQVAARLVSVTTPAWTKTVPASGHLALAATQARGTLVLRNWDPSASISFQAGTVFPNLNGDRVVNCPITAGTTMVLDAPVTVPRAMPSGTGVEPAVSYAPGHVLQPGAAGNIPNSNGTDPSGCYYYLWTNGFCTPGWLGYCHTVEPAGQFTGGQDAYNGPVVEQSDIDGTANSLTTAHQPNLQQVFRSRVRPHEQLAGIPLCAPQVSADKQISAQANKVTVTVAFTCTGEVYDRVGALEMAAGLLSQQAAANPGGAYALVGPIKARVINATVGSQGTITLVVSARGVWVSQFTARRLSRWSGSCQAR